MCIPGLFAVLVLVGIEIFARDGVAVVGDIVIVVFAAGITPAVGGPHADQLLEPESDDALMKVLRRYEEKMAYPNDFGLRLVASEEHGSLLWFFPDGAIPSQIVPLAYQ